MNDVDLKPSGENEQFESRSPDGDGHPRRWIRPQTAVASGSATDAARPEAGSEPADSHSLAASPDRPTPDTTTLRTQIEQLPRFRADAYMHHSEAGMMPAASMLRHRFGPWLSREDVLNLLAGLADAPVPADTTLQALETLEFAAGAIMDAIGLEDGLDGRAGETVLKMIDDALIANGRQPLPRPESDDDLAWYAKYLRSRLAQIEATGLADATPPKDSFATMLASIYLAEELRSYLDTLTITGENIGDIRRSCFMPWDSKWNGIVRDETAKRESAAPVIPSEKDQ